MVEAGEIHHFRAAVLVELVVSHQTTLKASQAGTHVLLNFGCGTGYVPNADFVYLAIEPFNIITYITYFKQMIGVE
jgi:hypothetical protein